MIKVKKVVAIDKNRIYPNCNVCGNGLSPYQIEGGLPPTTLKIFHEITDLILGKLNNKPVILLCNKCLELKEVNNEQTT